MTRPPVRWDFYLAHSGADAAAAEELYDHLGEHGARVFLDTRCLAPGDDWTVELQEQQRASLVTVILVSGNTPAAHYQRDEIDHAINLSRDDRTAHRVVPVYLDDSPPPTGLHCYHAIYAGTGGMADVAAQLLRALRWATLLPDPALPRQRAQREFAASIRAGLAEVGRTVHQLTQEQFRIIQILGDVRRVRIRGCPGSGKTLVAAEKAIRLAQAGVRTLFLCHNPLLAAYVSRLVAGSGVQVFAFGAWIAGLTGVDYHAHTEAWSNLEEPDEQTLGVAFDRLCEGASRYDAIVVDEGQDFRDEWWAVVEAGQRDPATGILYIFHDDTQALLPFRATYPISEPVLNLSRNCRNAGAVYQLMRFFDSTSPLVDPGLKDAGHTRFHLCTPGTERDTVGAVIARLLQTGLGGSITVLVGGGQSIEPFAAHRVEISVAVATSWQDEVREKLTRRMAKPDFRAGTPLLERQSIAAELARLSDSPFPTDGDIRLVRSIACRFSVDLEKINRETAFRYRSELGWVIKHRELELHRQDRAPLRSTDIILFFQKENWADGIPRPETWTLRPYYEPPAPRTVPVYGVSDFKGLESDAVVLCVRGKAPQMQEQLYVGISRARYLLEVVFDPLAASAAPFPYEAG